MKKAMNIYFSLINGIQKYILSIQIPFIKKLGKYFKDYECIEVIRPINPSKNGGKTICREFISNINKERRVYIEIIIPNEIIIFLLYFPEQKIAMKKKYISEGGNFEILTKEEPQKYGIIISSRSFYLAKELNPLEEYLLEASKFLECKTEEDCNGGLSSCQKIELVSFFGIN